MKHLNFAQKLVEGENEKGHLKGLDYNRRILVVEDEPNILDSYVAILAPKETGTQTRKSSRSQSAPEETPLPSDKFEITTAKNAADALQKVEKALKDERPFAMGFFDVLLGAGMDGIELVKKIHEMDPEMYAVFVTAYSDRGVDTINAFLGEDMSERWDYLNKPFSEGEIRQKARNAVSHWNLRREKAKQDQFLGEASRRLHEGERMVSVAAVARGVGHEFGNLLTQIMGQAELGKSGDEKRKNHALDVILKACETATHVLNRFKNLARPSQGSSQRKMIWAHSPLIEALEIMNHQMKTNNVKITRLKMDKVQIMASHSSLVQVFMNLFINSMHAMGRSGQLDFAIVNAGTHVEIKVRDYGPGIPKDILSKVTEPFFTTKGDEGTGLGLSICKEIIEIEHRGEFHVQNNSDKGLEVIMKLPIAGRGDDENATEEEDSHE